MRAFDVCTDICANVFSCDDDSSIARVKVYLHPISARCSRELQKADRSGALPPLPGRCPCARAVGGPHILQS